MFEGTSDKVSRVGRNAVMSPHIIMKKPHFSDMLLLVSQRLGSAGPHTH
jgi:hypothetical protein